MIKFVKSCFLVFILNQCTFAYLEYDSWLNLELYHAMDPRSSEKFTFRGNITIPSLAVGSANIDQEPLKTEDKNNLIKLAQDNGFYRLRALVSYPDGTKVDFLTSSKACTLINADLNDVIWVSVDSSGSVLAVTQTVAGSSGNCKINEINPLTNLNSFTTDVFIKHMELAPIPDTASFIQKLERERERGEVRDNRGFFAKYWMYIVPVVLLVLISGATNPEANSAAAGGGR